MSGIHLTRFAFGVALAAAALTAAHSASAYTYKVIHDFCSKRLCADGQTPMSGVVMDAAGNLYGTTQNGGSAFNGPGTAYKLTPNSSGTTWKSNTIHVFNSGGIDPQAVPILDTSGDLYGTTFSGTGASMGTVYELVPNGSRPHYLFKVLAGFTGTNGANPIAGLTYQGAATGTPYDGTSPLYGAAEHGGAHNGGTLYRLTLTAGWKLDTIYDFCALANCTDGEFPMGTPLVDTSGNILGTAEAGGPRQHGAVYELTESGGVWTQSVTHAFCQVTGCKDGTDPYNALTRDAPGNFYGTTSLGGQNKAGLVFQLAPGGAYTPVYNFCSLHDCRDGALPKSDLLLGSDGTFYGVTANGGGYNGDANHVGGGTVFALNGSTLQTLYSFCALENCRDGEYPVGGITIDAHGNLFGTTSAGGKNGAGVVFELSP